MTGSPTPHASSEAPGPAELVPGKPEAADLMWGWRTGGISTAEAVDVGAIRMRGVIRGVVGGIIGGLIFAFWSEHLAYVVFTISGISTVAAVVSPTVAYAWIEKLIGWVGFGLGAVMTWLTLVPIYYLVFAPFGVLGRRQQRARLTRAGSGEHASYWIERTPRADPAASYKNQF